MELIDPIIMIGIREGRFEPRLGNSGRSLGRWSEASRSVTLAPRPASGSSEIRAQFVLRRTASGGGRVPRAGLPASCSGAAWPDP